MFVSHSPLEKRILSVLDKIRHSRHVLITKPSTNSTTDESIVSVTPYGISLFPGVLQYANKASIAGWGDGVSCSVNTITELIIY